MENLPPEGSRISLEQIGSARLITIPYDGASPLRYFLGLFIIFWLGGWIVGFNSAISDVVSGDADPFLIFWLGGWTIGGIFALYFGYRVFRPTIDETLKLNIDSILYDSGIPPFQMHFGIANQKEMWGSLFPIRKKVKIRRDELQSLKLRETDSGNRLTVDSGAMRIVIAAGASEVEREWLNEYLSKNYS